MAWTVPVTRSLPLSRSSLRRLRLPVVRSVDPTQRAAGRIQTTDMRIALRQTTDLGLRAGRVLLGEKSLTTLGILDSQLETGADRRVRHIDNIGGFDVFVTDSEVDADADIKLAQDAGIPCVVPGTVEDPPPDTIVGANARSGLAHALAEQEIRRVGVPLEVSIGWTSEGQELRRGTAIAFPDPIGSLWARRAPSLVHPTFVAPVPGEWSGLSVRVTSASSTGVSTKLVGVADLTVHLDAIALAAAAATAADPGYPADVHHPWWSDAYLAKALAMGLTVAMHTTRES